MKYIDLHVHSTASDGTLSPAQLVHMASEINLYAMALTDHDTVDGIFEALEEIKRCNLTLTLVPGIELSAAYKESDIHILGLFIDYTSNVLKSALDGAKEERNSRNEKMVQNFRNAGIEISMEDLLTENKGAVITRAHFAKHLVKKGYAKTPNDAFNQYLSSDGPFFVKRSYLSPEASIELILKTGGIPILAHPLLYKLKDNELEALVCRLKAAGLAGLEALYSSNINNDEAYMRSLAKKYNLLLSGGSDFHGSVKPLIQLGRGRGSLNIPRQILTDLEDWLDSHRASRLEH